MADHLKLFEVRDRATCIPIIAVRLHFGSKKEQWLAARAGYTPVSRQGYFVLVGLLAGDFPLRWDPNRWSDPGYRRTLKFAHEYIRDHWDTLTSGDVVDVEFILGEKDKPSETEMNANG